MNSEFNVTIGIPTYNESKYIVDTIDSVINQDYKNFKLIISDNCSEDDTYNIIKEKYGHLENLLLVRQEKNIGASDNFNFLLNAADTPFFCWLGGHDVLDKSYLTKLLDYFKESKDLSLVYADSREIKFDGNRNYKKITTSDVDTINLNRIDGAIKTILKLNYCTPIHGIMKTNIAKGYSIKNIVGNDRVFVFFMALNGSLKMHKEVLYWWRNPREEEVFEEVIARYKTFGMSSKHKNVYTEMCKEYISVIKAAKKINLKDRLKLLIKVSYYLRLKYDSPYFKFLARLYWKYNEIRGVQNYQQKT